MRQSKDEGKDISRYEAIMKEIIALPAGAEKEARSLRCLDWMATLSPAENYSYCEPSDWDGIRAQMGELPKTAPCWPDMDQILGAWQGRCAGCLLGKPFEGGMAEDISNYYGIAQGAYAPLHYYRARAEEPVAFLADKAYLSIEKLPGMPVDDDTNYTVLALLLLDKNGKDFTRLEWADHFVRNLPPESTFTAERVAYRNLLDQIFPPQTALERNPYREWIGAQIRADLYGYVSPGDPLAAAYMAWKDASVTHVRSGIYGAMWVAASLALAYVMPAADAVRKALHVIPKETRFYQALQEALDDYDSGMTFEATTQKLRSVYHEKMQHHWCHTISNAVIVLNALLYDHNDLGQTLSMAVLPGFDTDCNGATAGSILGRSLGAGALDQRWIAPLKDHLDVSLARTDGFSLFELAQKTVRHIPGTATF